MQLEVGPLTKRAILGLVAKMWDQLGILAPVSINFRIDLQDLWHRGVAWDQPLDESDIERWKAHAIQMQELVTFQVPRSPVEAKRCSGPAAAALFQRWWSKRLRCCFLATVDTR